MTWSNCRLIIGAFITSSSQKSKSAISINWIRSEAGHQERIPGTRSLLCVLYSTCTFMALSHYSIYAYCDTWIEASFSPISTDVLDTVLSSSFHMLLIMPQGSVCGVCRCLLLSRGGHTVFVACHYATRFSKIRGPTCPENNWVNACRATLKRIGTQQKGPSRHDGFHRYADVLFSIFLLDICARRMATCPCNGYMPSFPYHHDLHQCWGVISCHDGGCTCPFVRRPIHQQVGTVLVTTKCADCPRTRQNRRGWHLADVDSH